MEGAKSKWLTTTPETLQRASLLGAHVQLLCPPHRMYLRKKKETKPVESSSRSYYRVEVFGGKDTKTSRAGFADEMGKRGGFSQARTKGER